MLFYDIIFSYSLTSTRTLTFGYKKWTPDVALIGYFLGVVFGQYFRQGMGKKTATKNTKCVCCHQFFLINLVYGVMSIY